jgi:hypothetical protein
MNETFLAPIEKPKSLIMKLAYTFSSLSRHYSEREICEIVWLVASEHLYNMTNIGLNIHSDMLCDISRRPAAGPSA